MELQHNTHMFHYTIIEQRWGNRNCCVVIILLPVKPSSLYRNEKC